MLSRPALTVITTTFVQKKKKLELKTIPILILLAKFFFLLIKGINPQKRFTKYYSATAIM